MKKLLNIGKLLGSAALVLGMVLGVGQIYTAFASATTLRVVQTPTTRLYTGISGSATSMRITPYPLDLDGTKLTITDFGTTPTLTVDPKVTNYEEIISFTGITDNGDNTATLTGLSRDLTAKYPYTTVGSGKTHGAGAIVVFGNNPQLYGRLAAPENDTQLSGTWNFNIPPIINDTNATATNQTASRAFVLQTAFGSLPIQKSGGGTGAASFPTGAFLYDSGAGTALSASSSPTVGYVTATTSIATSTFAGAINVTNASSTATSTFSGPLQANATTSIPCAANKACIINGLPYIYPSARAASSSVVYDDANGNLVEMPLQVATASTTVANASSNSNSTTTLATVAIPANTWNATHSMLRIISMWSEINGNGSCFMQTDYGTGAASTSINSYIIDGVNAGGILLSTTMAIATTTTAAGFSTTLVPATSNLGPTNVQGESGFASSTSITALTYFAFRSRSSGTNTCQLIGASVEVLTH